MNDFFQDGDLANFSESSAPIGIDADLELERIVFRDTQEEQLLLDIQDIVGSSNNDRINGSFEDNEIEGGSGNDFLVGQSGNDFLRGGDDNDFLIGGLGDDISEGGNGNDLIAANAGNDILSGGEGIDRFFYNGFRNVTSIEGVEPFGNDTIVDFERGTDMIQLTGFNTSFEDLDSNDNGLIDSGDATVSATDSGLSINYSNEFEGGSNVLTINNVDALDSRDLSYLN